MSKPAASGPPPSSDERAPFVDALAAYLETLTAAERERLEYAERMDSQCAGLPIDEAIEVEGRGIERSR